MSERDEDLAVLEQCWREAAYPDDYTGSKYNPVQQALYWAMDRIKKLPRSQPVTSEESLSPKAPPKTPPAGAMTWGELSAACIDLPSNTPVTFAAWGDIRHLCRGAVTGADLNENGLVLTVSPDK